MKLKRRILIISILIISLCISISAISATDLNSSDSTNIAIDNGQDYSSLSTSQSDNDLYLSDIENNRESASINSSILTDNSNIIYVDSSSESSIEDGSKENPYKTISNAVSNAQNNSEINVANGEYKEAKIDINKNLAIIGNEKGKVIITGSGTSIFNAIDNDPNLTLKNLVLQGINSTSGSSAAIYFGSDGNLTVSNCTISNISGKRIIYAYGDSIFNFIDSSVINSYIVSSTGSAIECNGNTANIINSTISNISYVNNDPYLYMRAVIYLNYNKGNLNILDSNICNCSGPIMSLFEVRGNSIIYNTKIFNNNISTSPSGNGGYGIFFTSDSLANLNIEKCLIYDNILYNNLSSFKKGTVDISYSAFVNNIKDNTKTNALIINDLGANSITCDNNWWGTNDDPEIEGLINVKANNWVVMNVNYNPSEDLTSSSNIEVSADFTKDNLGNDLSKSIVDGVKVDFASENGNFDPISSTTKNAIAYSIYNPIVGTNTITVSSSNVKVNKNFEVKGAPVVGEAIYVSKSGNDANDGSESSPVLTVEKAIELASFKNNKVIILDGEYVLASQTISSSLTIIANDGVVLSPNEDSIMFVIDGGNLTLKNIKFTNAKINSPSRRTYGTIISLKESSGNIVIDNCIFENNFINGAGSVIGSYRSFINLNITNSKFINNTATGTFGVIYIDGINYEGNVSIDNCVFVNNSAVNTVGVYIRSCDINMTNTNFINNSVTYPGIVQFYNSTANVNNCKFINNTCNYDSTSPSWVLSVEAPSNNVNCYCILNKTVFENNNMNNDNDYLIHVSAANTTIENSVLLNNKGHGKTLYVKGSSTQTEDLDTGVVTTKTVYGSITANNNWWGFNSNPINTTHIEDINNKIIIDKWIVMSVNVNIPDTIKSGDKINVGVSFNNLIDSLNNTSNYDSSVLPYDFLVNFSTIGGVVEPESINTVKGIANTVFTATDGNEHNIIISANNEVLNISLVKTQYLGIVYVSVNGNDNNEGSVNSPVKTIAKAIEIASAEGSVGKIIIKDGVFNEKGLTIDANLEISGSKNTVINGLNGQIFVINNGHNVKLNNLILVNSTGTFGSAIKNLKSNLTMDNMIIENNTVNSAMGQTISVVYNSGNMTIKNSKITNNNGYGLIYNGGNLNISDSNISNNDINRGYDSSFGIIYDTGNLVYINNVIFENNKARQGVIYTSYSSKDTLYVLNSKFIKNVMAVGSGAGINNNGKTLYVNNSSFIENSGSNYGGAIHTSGNANIVKSIFINNQISDSVAYDGSAIAVSGGNTDIHYCIFLTNNTKRALLWNDDEYSKVNAQYNWWGTNDNPVKAGLVKANSGEDDYGDDIDYPMPDASNWIVLNVTTNPATGFKENSPVSVIANFNHYFDNSTNTIKDLDERIPDGIEVNFTSITGKFNPESSLVKNGIANSIYTPISGDNDLTIQSANTKITIKINAEGPTPSIIDLYNSTFFNYFDKDGKLLSTVPVGSVLNFHGEFANLPNIFFIEIDKKVKLNGIDAIIKNMAFDLTSNDISVNNFTIISNEFNYGILVENTKNSIISNNIINVSSNKDFTYGVYAEECENLKFINNSIIYTGDTSGSYENYGFNVLNSNNVLVENNNMSFVIPSIDLKYDSNYNTQPKDAGIFIINTTSATFKNNNIKTKYNLVSGSWDTIYSIAIAGCPDITFDSNNISTIGNKYAYSINIYGIMNSDFSTLSCSDFLFKNNNITTVGDYYANGIQISGPGNGNFTLNILNVTAKDVSYPIYSSAYMGALNTEYTNNTIYGCANSVYGFELLGTKESVLYNNITLDGNYTLGIAANKNPKGIIIKNNTIILRGKGLSKPTSGDSIPSQNIGIIIIKSSADIQGNNISSTGFYGVNISDASNSKVIDNYIFANNTYGDFAVYNLNETNIVKDNLPTYMGIVYVSKDGNDINLGSKELPVASIKKAIEIATAKYGSGHIIIGEGVFVESGLDVNSPLIIEGAGKDKTIINGNSLNYIIKNLYTNLSLSNLALINGKNTFESAGALYALGNTTLNYVKIANSISTTGNGGAIYCVGNLKISNSEFINNTASTGGAIFFDDGSTVLEYPGSLIITNTSFENNNATNSYNYGGGAIRMQKVDGVKNIENCSFINNTASLGGAISYVLCDNEFIINNSKFINNTARSMDSTYYGGSAIYATSDYSQFKGELIINESLFENNKNLGNGGAIYIANVKSTINYSKFLNNTGLNNNQSIYNYKYSSHDASLVNVDYNWWGVNNPNKDDIIGSNDKNGLSKVVLNNWIIASIIANQTIDVPLNEAITVIITLNQYNDTAGNVKLLDDSNFPDVLQNINISYNGNGIEVPDSSIMSNGLASIQAVIKEPVWSIKAYLDNQELFINGSTKIKSATSISFDNDSNRNIIVSLVDSEGNPIKDASLSYVLNGVSGSSVTDENGNILISTLAEKNNLSVSYAGDENYLNSSASGIIIFKKPVRKGTSIICSNMTQTAVDFYHGERGGYFTAILK
ncbi:hypothetical protein BGI41_05390, partial [Methanobrevibacter sp. 87.7]|uniref:right-handed parallel beta-helix repeat-containing protein n=1 Tax=Methanobrevibacter sp. 87.7 TaxID=387957 RepID=UPI000B65E617